jgi:pimeloyl-ACP methyl ester carboxylesterase
MATKRLLGIPADDGETALGLWEMAPAGRAVLPPVLLVHGATFGSALFDLPLPGYSLMRELADGGRFVYAVDVSGYGASNANRVMVLPPQGQPPFSRAGDAIRDVGAAVSAVRQMHAAPSIDLIGFSWGSILAGWYAARHAADIRRLALYAPLFAEANPMWQERIGDPADKGRLAGHFGAYRLITLAEVFARWDSDVTGDPREVREEGVLEALFDTLLSNDPLPRPDGPPAFRCPNGALADLIEVFNGRPLYDPTTIVAPVLLVRGACDTTSTASDAQRLLGAVGSAEKVYLEIPDGSHFLCVEKNRLSLYRAISAFLAKD